MSDELNTYELKVRVLGNDVFSISLSTTSTSNKWVAISLVSFVLFFTVIGTYGQNFVELYKMLAG